MLGMVGFGKQSRAAWIGSSDVHQMFIRSHGFSEPQGF
jgi:hypothetical protein